MQIPNNSNIALLVHMIKRAEDPEAMEMWILSALIEYAEMCLAVDLDVLETQEEKNIAVNFKTLAFEVMRTIEMKHPKPKNLH